MLLIKAVNLVDLNIWKLFDLQGVLQRRLVIWKFSTFEFGEGRTGMLIARIFLFLRFEQNCFNALRWSGGLCLLLRLNDCFRIQSFTFDYFLGRLLSLDMIWGGHYFFTIFRFLFDFKDFGFAYFARGLLPRLFILAEFVHLRSIFEVSKNEVWNLPWLILRA